MKVADGFEVKLFGRRARWSSNPGGHEPWTEKGRVWVIECFEYPQAHRQGHDAARKPAFVILVRPTQRATGVRRQAQPSSQPRARTFPPCRSTLATGLEVGNGGVYVGAPAALPVFFNRETKNDPARQSSRSC